MGHPAPAAKGFGDDELGSFEVMMEGHRREAEFSTVLLTKA
jgi:hypothetical protein